MHIKRRALMASLAAILSAPALALQNSGSANKVNKAKPPRLRIGDTIGLIEPASASDEAFDVQLVEEVVRAMGLVPKRAPNLLKRYGYLAGQDKDRATDVTAMFADPSVRAILAVRGGWGVARILPYIDWEIVRKNPKLLIGYSDITALHLAIAAKGGGITIHGPNGGSAWGKGSLETFRPLVFDAATPLYENPSANEDRLTQKRWRTQSIRGGRAQGRLLGGNLTVLTALVGTPYLPSFDGAILFLEDIDEAEYRIDRMLTQLGQAGVLAKLKGAVFGQCNNCKAPGPAGYGGFPLSDILNQHFAPLGIPAYHGAWFGHMADQFSLPVGGLVEIDGDAGTLQLLEPIVI